MVILVLSVVWTRSSPISQVASDYVETYGPENSGFFLAGVGVTSRPVGRILF